ncbi:hypothetical protein HKX48_006694 [Thoreauomyces humboldtii]|nr:hypothetical protein HKX48_006694 [Thoreauomyces humboldtii]
MSALGNAEDLLFDLRLVKVSENEDPYLPIGEAYWDLKESLMNAELVLMRVLAFEVNVELPTTELADILDELQWENRKGRRDCRYSPKSSPRTYRS